MKFHQKIFAIAIIVYTITAFHSVGYFHFDEHYQIIEFAGILDGSNEPKDLPWEYGEQIRPALQPVIGYLIFQSCKFLSITSPYSKALILRLITAAFSLIILYFFSESCKKIVTPEYWKLFLILTYFLWFLPFINVRFSSETWSGLLLLLSVGLVIRNRRSYLSYFILGGILGLSFLFRYQIAFAIGGLILWLLIIRKENVSKLFILLFSFLIVVAAGVLIDSWYYGNWTITTLNYFVVNLIDGKAADFGTSPWYFYFFYIFRYSFFPIGITILLSLIAVTIKMNKSIIVWVIVPFIIGHSLISHKELRFLFPLINLVPILIIWTLDVLNINEMNTLKKNIFKVILIGIFSINITALVIASLKPAGSGRVRITEQIHKFNTKEQLQVIYSSNCNPYSPWDMTTNFYKESNATFLDVNLYDTDLVKSYDGNTVLVFSQEDAKNEEIQRIIKDMNMKEMGRSSPDFMLPFLKIYGNNTKKILILYGTE